ncbi:hypothetical protein OYE22_29565 [Streptomyces sp. 71268]|uniref:DUF6745 domain-containing protein n=1 Tax=Streptomyces sp. 71268 TaxID=3002640 RepID=UPI0023FA4301|nr:hypothetical protein [Streptomyces sp. 71268]WEV28871.1 hypothetical protein OYE22_29565 [Streptomyces sp. 71268]
MTNIVGEQRTAGEGQATGGRPAVDERRTPAPSGGAGGTDWRAVAATTAGADRAEAEAGVRLAYRQAGLAEPERVVWADSPLVGTAAVLSLTGQRATLPSDVEARAARALRAAGVDPDAPRPGRSVREAVRTAPWEAERRRVLAELGPQGWAARWALTSAPLWELTRGLTDRVRAGIIIGLAGPDQGRATGVVIGAGTTAPAPGAGPDERQGGVQDERRGEPQGEQRGAARETAVRLALASAVLGQHDAAWLAAFDGAEALTGVSAVARAAGWWWPYENVAVISERPRELHRDEAGRLDRGDGPALAYPDGFALYAWRGMPVPADFLEGLDALDARRIRTEENAELRRVMLEHYRYDRYLSESGAQPVHRDETGVLWRIELEGDEPVVMVEVVNSTPEPDGSSRTYWLRVPPRTRTAREGVAWTFGLSAEAYEPQRQT